MSAAALLVALLALFAPTARTRCIARRASEIAVQADVNAARFEIPAAVLLSVGMHESALGCDPRAGGGWGAPISRTHRDVPGGPVETASALALGYQRCWSSIGAVAHFRCGRCSCPPLVGYEPADAMRLVRRIDPRLR